MPKDIIKDFLLFNLIAEDSNNSLFEMDQEDDLLSEDSDDDLDDDSSSDLIKEECEDIEEAEYLEEHPFDEEEPEFDESDCPGPEDLDDDFFDYHEYDDGGSADYGYRDDVDYEE